MKGSSQFLKEPLRQVTEPEHEPDLERLSGLLDNLTRANVPALPPGDALMRLRRAMLPPRLKKLSGLRLKSVSNESALRARKEEVKHTLQDIQEQHLARARA